MPAGSRRPRRPFWLAVSRGESNKADHLFQWLWENAPRIEAFDLLLSVAIPKNIVDDHYFVFPAFTWRALETGVLDTEYFSVLMRPAVRYVSRFPIGPDAPGDRSADRGARADEPGHPPAKRRG